MGTALPPNIAFSLAPSLFRKRSHQGIGDRTIRGRYEAIPRFTTLVKTDSRGVTQHCAHLSSTPTSLHSASLLVFIMCGPGDRTDDLFMKRRHQVSNNRTVTRPVEHPLPEKPMAITGWTEWKSPHGQAHRRLHSLALSTSDQNPWRQHEESVAI